MYFKVILVLLFLFNLKINCQNLDSIFFSKKEKLNDLKTDTEKIKFLYDAGTYFYSKDINKSSHFFNEALSYLNDKRNTLEGKTLWKLAFIERNKGNLGTSLRYFNRAKKIFEDTNDHQRFASIHFDIGYLYRYKKQEDKELEFYKKGIKLSKNQKEEIIGKGYLHIGNYYTRHQQLDSSIYCYDKALKIFNKLNKKDRIYNVYNNMSNTYYQQGKYQKIIETRSLILNHAKEENNKLSLTVNYHNIGAAYHKLKKYKIASIYQDSAIAIAEKERFKVRLCKSYKSKSSTLYKLKEYKKAYKNHIKHKIYSDSIFKSQLSNKIKEVELENKLEIEKKNLQLTHQKQAYEKKLYLILFIIFLLLCICAIYSVYKKSIHKSIKIKSNLEKEKIKQEILLKKFKKSESEIKNLAADISMRLEFLKQLLKQLKSQIKSTEDTQMKNYIKDLSFKIQQQITTESNLTLLKKKIKSINDGFDSMLITNYKQLTKTERDVCALLRLNLSNKEIASIRNSNSDAIKATRYRIRKKMNIPKDEKLEFFIQNLKS